MLNVVESYNNYCDWFVIGNHGAIADNDPDEFDKRVKYCDLPANCAILHTIVDLTGVAHALLARGYALTRADMQHITPYLTQHIEFYGQYTLDMTPTVVFQ